jgi:hypothetical protein
MRNKSSLHKTGNYILQLAFFSLLLFSARECEVQTNKSAKELSTIMQIAFDFFSPTTTTLCFFVEVHKHQRRTKPRTECTCTLLASTNSKRLTRACPGKRHDSRGVKSSFSFSLFNEASRRDVIVYASHSLPKHFQAKNLLQNIIT